MKTIKIFLILFFIAFIFSASTQYFYPVVKVKKVNENRTKVERPHESLWVGLREGAGYATTVERFFSDHFPLRDLMLRSLGQFEYFVLGRSREVIVGKDGWLSDKKVLAEQLHQLDRVNDEQIKLSVIQLKRLQHWLKGKDVDFLMVIVPMKPTIYAEKFPEYAQRPDQTGLQRFQKALDSNDVPFIDVLSIFNEHKNGHPLYYRTDVHWNSVGASYIAEAIVNHFSSRILGKPIWNEQIIKSEQKFSGGGELSTIPLLFPESEITPTWSSANPGYIQRIGGDGPTAVEIFSGTDKTRILLPPSIMFGNSFMLQYPTVGYHSYFSESTRVLDYQFFSKALDYVKPRHKIFVLHIYETQLLFHILPPDSYNYWDKRIQHLPLPLDFKYKV